MTVSELVGYFAAALTTMSFVPQTYLVWKTRNTESVSLGMYLISWPIILANAATLSLALSILMMKLRYGNKMKVRAAQEPSSSE
jgi:MtN3 and saliva related transmembrane protein